jgi:hypothetical protein
MKLDLLMALPLAAMITLAACEDDLPTQLPGSKLGSFGEGVVGDSDGNDDPTDDPANQNGATAAGEENTFDHPDGLGGQTKDPFEALEQRQSEGPPEVRSRLHSCQKIQNAALRNMLTAFGVDLAATGDPDPAGELYNKGRDALGGANYASRKAESILWTNSGATKAQDIWAMAAGEIIANLPNAPHCQIDGVGPTLFAEDSPGTVTCNDDAVSCLIGRPATEEHLAICNHIVASATDPEKGKRLAVAALLAAAHTCE